MAIGASRRSRRVRGAWRGGRGGSRISLYLPKDSRLNKLAICDEMCSYVRVRRNIEVEATLVAKFVTVSPELNERGRRVWAAAEAVAIGYGGDALVSSATGLARETIRKGRREIARGVVPVDRQRRPGAGRPRIQTTQPGITEALEALVDPLTRGDPTSPLRWTCLSRASSSRRLLTLREWRVSSRHVGRLSERWGYSLQSRSGVREPRTPQSPVRTQSATAVRWPPAALAWAGSR